MPLYDYRCLSCKKTFTVTLSMKEHDKAAVTCPGCKGRKVEQQISAFIAKTDSKS